jgi:hypothetical protein
MLSKGDEDVVMSLLLYVLKYQTKKTPQNPQRFHYIYLVPFSSVLPKDFHSKPLDHPDIEVVQI